MTQVNRIGLWVAMSEMAAASASEPVLTPPPQSGQGTRRSPDQGPAKGWVSVHVGEESGHGAEQPRMFVDQLIHLLLVLGTRRFRIDSLVRCEK